MESKKGKNEYGFLIVPFENATVSYNACSIANHCPPTETFQGDNFYCLQGAFRVFTNPDGTIYINNLKKVEMYLVTVESGREQHCHIAVCPKEVRVLPNFFINEQGVTQKYMFNQRADYLTEKPDVPEFTVRLKRKNYCQRIDFVPGWGRPVSIIIFGLEPIMVRFNGDYACHRVKKLLGLTDVKLSGGFDVYELREDRDSTDESTTDTNSQDSSKEYGGKDESDTESEVTKTVKTKTVYVKTDAPSGHWEVLANHRFTEMELQGAMIHGESRPEDFPKDVSPIIRKPNTVIRSREKTQTVWAQKDGGKKESVGRSEWQGETKDGAHAYSTQEVMKRGKKPKSKDICVTTVPAGYLESFGNRLSPGTELLGAMNLGANQPAEFPSDLAPIIRKSQRIHGREASVQSTEKDAKPSPSHDMKPTVQSIQTQKPVSGVEMSRKKLEIPKEDEEIMKATQARRKLKKKANETEKRKKSASTDAESVDATKSSEKAERLTPTDRSARRTRAQLNLLVKGLSDLITKLHTDETSDDE